MLTKLPEDCGFHVIAVNYWEITSDLSSWFEITGAYLIPTRSKGPTTLVSIVPSRRTVMDAIQPNISAI